MSHEASNSLDIREQSRTTDGRPMTLDRRLYMQLYAFGGCDDAAPLIAALTAAAWPGVLYEDLHDPRGIALLTWHEHADFFITDLRRLLRRSPFGELTLKPEYTMFGRTYAQGHEADLEQALITRPRQKLCDPTLSWAIWYPLRRTGAFERLSADEQRVILMEHGGIGHAFGRAGYGTDIRLACYGLDRNDNDFVIGLLGPDLHPLSALVQRMRKTKQTSQYIERMGPFFVGKAIWQNREAA